MSERELQLWSELMKVPHGDIPSILEIHRGIRDENPLFYVKIALWYQDNGTVRDHKVAFVRSLFEAKEVELRDAGWALLQDMPFYLMQQVVLQKNPRSLRSAAIHYLANMEDRELTYHLLRSARLLKNLVKKLHIPTTRSKDGKPIDNPNLQKIGMELFSGTPVIRKVFKDLENAQTPEEITSILKRTRLPPMVAISAIKVRTPAIMRELIRSMSVNELLQSLNSLGRMGYLKPNIEIIRGKLERAIEDKRISVGRLRGIQRNLDIELVPPELLMRIKTVTRARAKKESKLDARVAINVDFSGSMDDAMIAAKQIAVSVAMACRQPPMLFTSSALSPTQIIPKEWTFDALDQEMTLLRAQGGTPLGSGVILLQRTGNEVDVIILISDMAENAAPFFINEYRKLPYKPRILILRVPGASDILTSRLTAAGLEYERMEFTTYKIDQYSIDQIVRFIGQASPFDTILEIMELPIPTRPEETKHPKYWMA